MGMTYPCGKNSSGSCVKVEDLVIEELDRLEEHQMMGIKVDGKN